MKFPELSDGRPNAGLELSGPLCILQNNAMVSDIG